MKWADVDKETKLEIIYQAAKRDGFIDGNCYCCGGTRLINIDGPEERCVGLGHEKPKCKYAVSEDEGVCGCSADDRTDGNCKGEWCS